MKPKLYAFVVLIVSLLLPTQAFSQDDQPVKPTSMDATKVNILFVGAHPDDESTALATMTRYVLDGGAVGGVITATRGEGGGNAVGRELGPSLGIVRDIEERSSLRSLGIYHLYPLDELDWAYTTSANATEIAWGHEDPLGKLVRFYRVLRPDVVITMNPSPRGHGHHQYIAKLATEAFFLAGDPTAFPEQIEEEFIEPWQPKKLYYALAYGAEGLETSLEVPTNEYSPSQYRTYADLVAGALQLYRSQGFDAFFTVPAPSWSLGPETFTLAASVLPTPAQETSLLDGIFTGVDSAPAGVEMEVRPAQFYASQGSDLEVSVEFRNFSDTDLSDLTLSLEAPENWTVSGSSEPANVAVGESASATFTVAVPDDADVVNFQKLVGRFIATDTQGLQRTASSRTVIQVTPPVAVELQPIEAVRIYREWTKVNHVEHLIRLVPAEIAVGAGETGTLPVILTNRSDADHEVTVSLAVDSPDITLDAAEQTVTVAAGETTTVDFMATIPADMAQTTFNITVDVAYDGYQLNDAGVLQVVPSLTVARLTTAPTIDGDLSEYDALPSYEIPFDRVWEGAADDAADLTSTFKVAYDDEFLYIAMDVTDNTVVSNIAPNDIKGHWRSDSVEITVDPLGAGGSENSMTTFKTGIFPFDTEGNVQAERDADANQGVIGETAPDMKVASARTDTGYVLEVAIPWNAVPGTIEAGQNFGFDVLLYDCDKADAAIGENCNEARTAWSAWDSIQGTPRLWGHATLEP
ncbi:MAG TPA: sugar-binding protein [Aggregatilineaceae bacterium]|nr:sugar-binding protein [Aggregatilineaceae bacterium]